MLAFIFVMIITPWQMFCATVGELIYTARMHVTNITSCCHK